MAKKKTITLIDWIDMGIFTPKVMFSVGYDVNEIMAYLWKIKATGWADALSKDMTLTKDYWYGLRRTVEVIKTGEKCTYFFIIIPRFDFDNDDDYVKLAHECLHICQFFLPDVLDRNREFECEAYLHTHLFRQCLKKIRG